MCGLLSKRDFLRLIRSMNEYEFEQFIGDIWNERGFDTTVRQGSGDRGIDVVARRDGEKQLIQAKRYQQSNKVGSKQVREYATLYQQVEDADSVVIVTTSSFTEPSQELAWELDVEIIDGEALFEIVNASAPNIAIKYLHQDSTRAGRTSSGDTAGSNQTPSSSSTIPSPTASISRSPFENENELIETTEGPDLVSNCPECGSSDVWRGKIRKGVIFTLIKCADCGTVWAIDDPWPSKSVQHRRWKQLDHEDEVKRKEDSCFIATAAYGTPQAAEIDQLRDFRDEFLLQTRSGQWFVSLYYSYSPPVADWVSQKESRKRATRAIIIRPSLFVAKVFKSVFS